MTSLRKTFYVAGLLSLALAGCGTPATPISGGSTAPIAAQSSTLDLSPFAQAQGALAGLIEAPDAEASNFKLVPGETQGKADQVALKWAPDARQIVVAWGYAVTSLLGETQHIYYSPSRGQILDINFKVTPWFPASKTMAAPTGFNLADRLLRPVADTFLYTAQSAHDQAVAAGYHASGLIQAGALVDPVLLGPTWIFFDSPTHLYPEAAVNADTGAATTGGLEMDALRLLFSVAHA